MNFLNRMKEIIQKNLVNQKALSEQSLEKAKGFGKMGLLYHEINELEKDVQNKFLIVGNEVYSTFMKKKQRTISKNTNGIKDILLEILILEKLIIKKEVLLKQRD